MAIANTEHPWNEWRGMHEGDMIEELAEHDSVRFGIPRDEARETLQTYDTEQIRKAWWYAIGRNDL